MESLCRRLPVFSVSLGLVLLFSSAMLYAADAPDAAVIYKSKCAMCHGPDGAGKTAMGPKLNIRDLHSADVQKQSDAELAQAITKGKNKMPAFEGKLSPDQIKALVAYVRELGKKH